MTTHRLVRQLRGHTHGQMGGTLSRRELHLLTRACLAEQEFRRLQAALGAARDRAELFAGSGENSPLQQGTSSTGLLLRERGNLHNTNTAVRHCPAGSHAFAAHLMWHSSVTS